MKLQAPHWVTLVVASVGVCAGALVAVFPDYATLLGAVSAICAGLAAPTLKAGSAEPSK